MGKHKISVLALLVASALLAACGAQTTRGVAVPQGGPVTRASASLERLLAPAVPTPLKYEVFHNAKNICKIISIEQAQKLGINQLKVISKENDALGIGCVYGSSDESNLSGFSVTFADTHKNGLSDVYAQRSNMAYWIPTALQAYPAVMASVADGRNANCVIDVGVTDQVDAMLIYDGDSDPTKKIACQKVRQLGNEFITTLKLQK